MGDGTGIGVVVVGGGLAGLACAGELAAAGIRVRVFERREAAGSESMAGGRLSLGSTRELASGLVDGLPFERALTRESISLLSGGGSATVTRRVDGGDGPPELVSVLRSRLDPWLAERAVERGAEIEFGAPVEALALDGRRVCGVVRGGETVAADLVVLADGALSVLAEHAGLHSSLRSSRLAIAVREVLALDRGRLEDRFRLEGDEGLARTFLGEVVPEHRGAAFLHTHRESVALGVVLGIDDFREAALIDRPDELIAGFEQRAELRPLLRDAERVGTSAHIVPQGDVDDPVPHGGPGVLVAGEAGGFAIHRGLTVRGMDLALGSGVLAARAIVAAAAGGDAASGAAAEYDRLLVGSHVGRDLEAARALPAGLHRRPWIETYPDVVMGLLGDVLGATPGEGARRFADGWTQLVDALTRAPEPTPDDEAASG